MSVSEKAAWMQLIVCLAAIAVVTLLLPWLGHRATAGFALLALVTLSAVFYRRRGNRIVVDERDMEIERRATSVAVGTTWVGLITVLASAGMWSNYSGVHSVSTVLLNWLIWLQFVACFGIKAIASIVLYRSQQHAA
ncbi:MAG: hypothetical protein KF708_12300 [Pirellulales bacterium]|nr:hypothetical protein [Pirellulales bacterium]